MKPQKKLIEPEAAASAVVEDIVGCKWSLAVLMRIRAGVHRPGELERSIAGLSKKVLNERLRKLQRHGIVDKQIFAEAPPRVEYRITARGERFGALLDQLQALEREWTQTPAQAPKKQPRLPRGG